MSAWSSDCSVLLAFTSHECNPKEMFVLSARGNWVHKAKEKQEKEKLSCDVFNQLCGAGHSVGHTNLTLYFNLVRQVEQVLYILITHPSGKEPTGSLLKREDHFQVVPIRVVIANLTSSRPSFQSFLLVTLPRGEPQCTAGFNVTLTKASQEWDGLTTSRVSRH